MEWYNYIMIGLGIVGFLLQGFGLAIGGTWKLAQMEKNLTATINQHRREVDDTIATQADVARRQFGETIMAMQTKIHEFEKWTRDTFVRRESFMTVTKEVKDTITGQGEKTEKRLDRIDEKLDRLQEQMRS